jgi:hypothetical protein
MVPENTSCSKPKRDEWFDFENAYPLKKSRR